MADKKSTRKEKEPTPEASRVREAYQKLGKLGGQVVKAKYGPEFYSQIGKKGGETVKNKYGPKFFHNIGEKGGEARKEQLGHDGYQELGHIGGQVVKDKYGQEFYSQIGKKGGEKGGEARKAQMARGEIVTKKPAERRGVSRRVKKELEPVVAADLARDGVTQPREDVLVDRTPVQNVPVEEATLTAPELAAPSLVEMTPELAE